jgi:MFS family permease
MSILLMRYRSPVVQAPADRVSLRGAWRLFLPYWKELGALYFAQVFLTGTYFAMIFLMPDLLQARGYPHWVVFGGSQVCLTMASFLFALPLGYFSDRVSHNRMLKITIFSSLVLFYTLLFADHLSVSALMVLLFFMGASMGLINPLLVAFGTRLMSDRISTVSALLMGSAWCLSHLGPLTAGILTTVFEVNATANALKVMGIYIFFAAFLIMTLPRLAPVKVGTLVKNN